MPLPTLNNKTSVAWRPTLRTHVLHTGIAVLLLVVSPFLGTPPRPLALLVTALSLACLPLASLLPAGGAVASLVIVWFAAVSPFDLGFLALVMPWALCIMLLGRGHRREVVYLLALATTLVLLSASPAPRTLATSVTIGTSCLILGEVVRHHRQQIDLADLERKRKLDQQRRLVVSELHDTVVRDLSHAVMIAEQARLAAPDDERLNRELTAVITPVRTAVEHLRRSLRAMSAAEGDDSLLLLASSPPPPLTDTIRVAQEALSHRDSRLITYGTELLNSSGIGPGIHQQLVRVIAELINNVTKYTPASSDATLTIETDDDTLECMCTNPIDRPRPFDTATSSHLGLDRAEQRIESLGGIFHVAQSPDRWTTVFSVPLRPAAPLTTN